MDQAETAAAIRRNSLKSVAIIVAFPLVLPAFLFVIALVAASIAKQHRALAIALQTFTTSLIIMVLVTVVWLPIGYFLNQWIIDQATGARLVSRSEMKHVWAMLDNLSRRCGIRTPALRVIDTDALNAYASGLTEGSYCVTVTSGLVATLEDEELEGVLAHEITHIVHHDVRLMVVAGILVGTIPLVHDIAMKMFWALIMGVLNLYRAILTIMKLPGTKLLAEVTYLGLLWVAKLVAYGIGLVATMCSLMLQFALSRRREFMADAGAVTLTGNPAALMSALRKISGNATLDTALAAVRAMCIENGATWFGLFSTHPPIEDRITALSRLASRSFRDDEPEPDPVLTNSDDRHERVSSTPPSLELEDRPTLDPAVTARYRALLLGASPENLDIIAREHLYRRARETVQKAQAQNPSLTMAEVALARAHLEAAIEQIEIAVARRGRVSGILPPQG